MLVERAGYLGIDAADLPEVTESNTGGAAKQPNFLQIMGWRMKEASRASNRAKGVTDELPIQARIENLVNQKVQVGRRLGVLEKREAQYKVNTAEFMRLVGVARESRQTGQLVVVSEAKQFASEAKQFASEVKLFAAVPRNQGFKTVQGIVGTFQTLSAGKSPEKVDSLAEFTKNALRDLLDTGDEKTERAVNQSIKMIEALAGGTLSTSSKEADQVNIMINEFHRDMVDAPDTRASASSFKRKLESLNFVQRPADANTDLSAGAKEHLDRVIQQGLKSIEPYLFDDTDVASIMDHLRSSSKREAQTTADFVKPFRQQLLDLEEKVDRAKGLPPGLRKEIKQAIDMAFGDIHTLISAGSDMLASVKWVLKSFYRDVQNGQGTVQALVNVAKEHLGETVRQLESENNRITGLERDRIKTAIENVLEKLNDVQAATDKQMQDVL
ncbi:hypothetical protein COB21_06100 [Candidatus Aerophobetes bacterium]|uniref:Uncharacterized protein n=1 Tax=Aerophobetes bacterium TaxID=2030807 RepID=A0A2A4WYD9_UNCAE|nr:MAG: hypothetical protein COB21_06100 [Candidatus Aerophobetes bacterium]